MRANFRPTATFVVLVAAMAMVNSVAAQDKKEPEKKGNIVRQRDLIQIRNDFRQMGLAYQTYVAEHNKGPKDLADFRPSLQGQNKIIEMLEKGDVVFFYGVSPQQMEKGSSNTILAHEAYVDTNNRRLVLMGDNSVREMNADEFAKAPKAKN